MAEDATPGIRLLSYRVEDNHAAFCIFYEFFRYDYIPKKLSLENRKLKS